jgi:DNA-binding CsgD family transcriptional regulator
VLAALEKFADRCAPTVSIAMLDRTGSIVAVNHAWKEFARRNGLRLPHYGVGANYLEYCARDSSARLQSEIRNLLAGKSNLLTHIYPCNSPTQRRWFFMIGLPLGGRAQSGVALMHVDITSFLPESGRVDTKALAGSLESSSLLALSQQVIGMLADRTSKAPQHPEQREEENIDEVLDLAGLSRRQLEILGLLAEGKTNTEIAEELQRSPNTIREHVSAILRQLNLKSRTQAALLASKHLKQHFDLCPKPAGGHKRR